VVADAPGRLGRVILDAVVALLVLLLALPLSAFVVVPLRVAEISQGDGQNHRSALLI
jgi:hypothetical protein